MKPIHDREFVRARLVEAGETLRRLKVSGCWPEGLKSNWPDMLQQYAKDGVYDPSIASYTGSHVRLGPPLARDIDRMDEALEWISGIQNVTHRKLLWAVVLKGSKEATARRLGCHRNTVRHWTNDALDKIAGFLMRKSQKGLC